MGHLWLRCSGVIFTYVRKKGGMLFPSPTWGNTDAKQQATPTLRPLASCQKVPINADFWPFRLSRFPVVLKHFTVRYFFSNLFNMRPFYVLLALASVVVTVHGQRR